MAGCLDGVRVLELARYQAGPRAGMFLSDLGAEVIKIEKIGGEKSRRSSPRQGAHSIYFSVYNRGKKSICLDMRQEEGKAVFRDLLKTADFVLENFRPGTMAKMGLDYDSLRRIKPDIILLSASAFGQYGPYRERPGFDGIGQAMSGLMTLTGQPVGQPLPVASSVCDRYTALHLTIGALAALRHRDLTGEGQVIDVCLFDSALTMVEIPTIDYLNTGYSGPEVAEIKRPPFRAKDGCVIMSYGPPKMKKAMRELLGGSAEGPGEIKEEEIDAWCAARTVQEICDALCARGIVVAPVLSIPEVSRNPHLWEREMLVKMPDAEGRESYLPGLTIKFSKTPGKLGPVPEAGQDTDEVLARVAGYDQARITQLRAAGII